MSYRLHISVPLGENQSDAIAAAKTIMSYFSVMIENTANEPEVALTSLSEFAYQLLNDTDRGASNYLDIDINGHARNKKLRAKIGDRL